MIDKGLGSEIAEGAIILDVRTEDEYNTGRIKGSINIPFMNDKGKIHGT